MTENLVNELKGIVGKDNVSDDPKTLDQYSSDLSFVPKKLPQIIVWPKNTEAVQQIVQLANKEKIPLVPVSSISKIKFHGDTIPHIDNSIILNLSKMKEILRIDEKARDCMVEPGVTFKELIPELDKYGLRLNMPLYPRGDKSALTAALEREPVIIPKYQWDSSDPLLCTEVIFGSGDLFRTGAAAGPGTIEDQLEVGQSQKNPMGPTQFSPYRLLQGAQGSMGIITWATLKCEYKPTLTKLFYVNSNLEKLLDLEHQIIKYRLCDEILIINNLNLAVLLKKSPSEIESLVKNLPEWTLIFVLSGRGKLDKDKIEYQEGDIQDFAKGLNLTLRTEIENISNDQIMAILTSYAEDSWKLRLTGGCQDIIFISAIDKIKSHIDIVRTKFPENLGVYLQPIVQGTSHGCEFDIYYNPQNDGELAEVKAKYITVCKELIGNGAFFNRPYGIITKEVYEHQSSVTCDSLWKVKKIFDPNNIMNPNVLCFEGEP